MSCTCVFLHLSSLLLPSLYLTFSLPFLPVPSTIPLPLHLPLTLHYQRTLNLQACLVHYDYSPEAVIDHVLLENLPLHLRELDRSLPANWQGYSHIEEAAARNDRGFSPPKEAAQREGESLLEQRSNIFDYDEFDVFHRKEVDQSRVHIGKK